VLSKDGTPLLLRERAGDYMRQLFAEASGFAGDPPNLGTDPLSLCSRDSCVAAIRKDGREWRLFATRTATLIDWTVTTSACGQADIVVSDRRLPRGCTPRWLKLDRTTLAQTGGVAIYLRPNPYVETVAERVARHPWAETSPPSVHSTRRVRFRPGR
jgi:competence protein ComEC